MPFSQSPKFHCYAEAWKPQGEISADGGPGEEADPEE